MRYVMREKLLSFGNDFTIRDEHGNDRLIVDGKVFSIGDSLTIRDLQGNEVAQIQQRLLSWGPTYEITRDGQTLATVKKQLFTFFFPRYTVDVPGPDDLEAQGDFFDHEYSFTRGGRTVAQVSKRWFSWSDTYGIDIADGEDEVLILASAVVIDAVLDDEQRQQNRS